MTPTIEGRTDLPLYQNGAKKIINWLILPSGGLTRRPGTEFVWAVQGSGKADASDTSSTDGSGSSVSISSDSEDGLPPIGRQEELTFVPVAQDPTSRQYRVKAKRDERPRFFDYGILDEEDAVYRGIDPAPEEKKG